MTTETINGLLTQKPGRDPQQGEIKLFTIEHRKGKSGKPYIKVKNATVEQGGQPYRVLSAEKTNFVDQHGNISFSVEIEASSSQPSAFQQARSAMSNEEIDTTYDRIANKANDESQIEKDAETMWGDLPKRVSNEQESTVPRSNGGDGVSEARKRLCQVANLYALCVRCANSRMIADEIPEDHKRNEQFQSTLASIWIYMSSRRSNDGVTWWDYTDKMPTTPITPSQSQQGKSGPTAPLNPKLKSICTCENTDGDNPLCPVHSE